MVSAPIGNHPAGRHLWNDADERLVREMSGVDDPDPELIRVLTLAAGGALIVAGALLGLLATRLSGWTIAAGVLITTGTALLVRARKAT